MVEQIISDKLMRRPHDAEVSQWIASRDEALLKRLRAVGLADGVGVTQTSLGMFLQRVSTTWAVKRSTATFYGHTLCNLRDYFTPSRFLMDITEADADAWRSWLVTQSHCGPNDLAEGHSLEVGKLQSV